ncbi:hypothetical protein QQ054_11005 [Oscillatoria amoena NRMC-F 0135]|nr:hypothetical protein [Oscillatoria amoena NRMC-F 0135]
MRARIRHVGQRVAVAPPNWQSRLMSLLANSRQEALTKIQFSGWAIIVSSLLIGGVAYNTGNNLVFIILAAILSIIILSGILSKFNLRRVETLSLDCPSVGDAAEPLTIRISSDQSDFQAAGFWDRLFGGDSSPQSEQPATLAICPPSHGPNLFCANAPRRDQSQNDHPSPPATWDIPGGHHTHPIRLSFWFFSQTSSRRIGKNGHHSPNDTFTG